MLRDELREVDVTDLSTGSRVQYWSTTKNRWVDTTICAIQGDRLQVKVKRGVWLTSSAIRRVSLPSQSEPPDSNDNIDSGVEHREKITILQRNQVQSSEESDGVSVSQPSECDVSGADIHASFSFEPRSPRHDVSVIGIVRRQDVASEDEVLKNITILKRPKAREMDAYQPTENLTIMRRDPSVYQTETSDKITVKRCSPEMHEKITIKRRSPRSDPTDPVLISDVRQCRTRRDPMLSKQMGDESERLKVESADSPDRSTSVFEPAYLKKHQTDDEREHGRAERERGRTERIRERADRERERERRLSPRLVTKRGGRNVRDDFYEPVVEVAPRQVTPAQVVIPRQSPAIHKPLIVIDAANAAIRHGGFSTKTFSSIGIELVIEYYQTRHHKVLAFLPEYLVDREGIEKAKRENRRGRIPDDVQALLSLIEDNLLCLTPPQDYDDLYCIKYAQQHDGCVVSNDMYRDYIEMCDDRRAAKDWVKSHCISFTFATPTEFLPNPQFRMPPLNGGPVNIT